MDNYRKGEFTFSYFQDWRVSLVNNALFFLEKRFFIFTRFTTEPYELRENSYFRKLEKDVGSVDNTTSRFNQNGILASHH